MKSGSGATIDGVISIVAVHEEFSAREPTSEWFGRRLWVPEQLPLSTSSHARLLERTTKGVSINKILSKNEIFAKYTTSS